MSARAESIFLFLQAFEKYSPTIEHAQKIFNICKYYLS